MTTKYTKDHEYIKIDGNIATVGITDHAQSRLGDIVFIELPDLGKVFSKGDDTSVVESVKAASEIYAPVSGEVVEINTSLEENVSLVNTSAEDEGWFFKLKISNEDEINELIDEEEYIKLFPRIFNR